MKLASRSFASSMMLKMRNTDKAVTYAADRGKRFTHIWKAFTMAWGAEANFMALLFANVLYELFLLTF